jgi:hypothetical protein
MNITIGTPPQNVTVVFDTGSSDLIVNSPSSELCKSGRCVYGTFDANKSTSLQTIDHSMSIVYTVGQMMGQWARDTVEIQGVKLDNFVLGVGDNASGVAQNVLGVGFPDLPVFADGSTELQDTPGVMAVAGAINTAAFSVYLRNNSNSNGAVIFGGLDKAHYTGDLVTYPIVPNVNQYYDRLAVNVSAVEIDGIKTNSTMRTLLDTGEPDLRLPTDFVKSVWEKYNVTGLPVGDPKLGVVWGLIDCSMANSSATVNVSLPGLSISIPFQNLVLDPSVELITAFGKRPSDVPKGTCLFNFNDAGSDPDVYVLGIPFLQSAYAIFDLDSKEISLAPVNQNPGPSDIVEITNTTVPAPKATDSGSLQNMPVSSVILLGLVGIFVFMQ